MQRGVHITSAVVGYMGRQQSSSIGATSVVMRWWLQFMYVFITVPNQWAGSSANIILTGMSHVCLDGVTTILSLCLIFPRWFFGLTHWGGLILRLLLPLCLSYKLCLSVIAGSRRELTRYGSSDELNGYADYRWGLDVLILLVPVSALSRSSASCWEIHGSACSSVRL